MCAHVAPRLHVGSTSVHVQVGCTSYGMWVGIHVLVQTVHWRPRDAGSGASIPAHAQMGLLVPAQQCYYEWEGAAIPGAQ